LLELGHQRFCFLGFFPFLLPKDCLELCGPHIGEDVLRELARYQLNRIEQILLDVAYKVFDLGELEVGRPYQLRGTGVVVGHCYAQDLQQQHRLHLLLDLLFLVHFFELGYLVLFFVGEFPPVRAQLADGAQFRLPQIVQQLLQLLLHSKKVLKVELEVGARFIFISFLKISNHLALLLLITSFLFWEE